jgi:hypothetical protein
VVRGKGHEIDLYRALGIYLSLGADWTGAEHRTGTARDVTWWV